MLDKLGQVITDSSIIVRLGQSMTRPDLNEKYALEATKRNDPAAYERV